MTLWPMKFHSLVILAVFSAIVLASTARGSDWPRFRGINGTGVTADTTPLPEHWTESVNLKWSVELPGPGSSCPIVVEDRVFVTCWSGYGTDVQNPGDQADLRRHLVCIDRGSGKVLWTRTVEAYLPEDEYSGMFTEHGYASHTPVSDGERVFVFFGKTGVLAFDMEGNQLWQANVGTDSGASDWGTASSPILYQQTVIVPATAESQALVALDQATGEEVWRQEAEGLRSTWSTPILVELSDGRQELVMVVPNEIWGINPDNGKLRWYCRGPQSDTACASVIASGDVVYAIGGREGGSTAVRAGGEGDVSDSHVLWTGKHSVSIGTPLLYQGLIHWVSRGVAHCVDAATGEDVYQKRLATRVESDSAEERKPSPTAQGSLRGRSYASLVAGDGKLYFLASSGDTFVMAAGPEFKQLAINPLLSTEEGDETFQASPALSNGEIFIRSSKKVYCIGAAD